MEKMGQKNLNKLEFVVMVPIHKFTGRGAARYSQCHF